MKISANLFIAFLFMISFKVMSQNSVSPNSVSPNEASLSSTSANAGKIHKGFYARFGIGPVFGKASYDDTGALVAQGEVKGTGAAIELLIGGAIKENLILHLDLVSRALVDPEVSLNSSGFVKTQDFSFSEASYGAGVTYYFMPINIYTSGSLGVGTFVFTDDKAGTTNRSDFGLAINIKAGKMFWIGK